MSLLILKRTEPGHTGAPGRLLAHPLHSQGSAEYPSREMAAYGRCQQMFGNPVS